MHSCAVRNHSVRRGWSSGNLRGDLRPYLSRHLRESRRCGLSCRASSHPRICKRRPPRSHPRRQLATTFMPACDPLTPFLYAVSSCSFSWGWCGRCQPKSEGLSSPGTFDGPCQRGLSRHGAAASGSACAPCCAPVSGISWPMASSFSTLSYLSPAIFWVPSYIHQPISSTCCLWPWNPPHAEFPAAPESAHCTSEPWISSHGPPGSSVNATHKTSPNDPTVRASITWWRIPL